MDESVEPPMDCLFGFAADRWNYPRLTHASLAAHAFFYGRLIDGGHFKGWIGGASQVLLLTADAAQQLVNDEKGPPTWDAVEDCPYLHDWLLYVLAELRSLSSPSFEAKMRKWTSESHKRIATDFGKLDYDNLSQQDLVDAVDACNRAGQEIFRMFRFAQQAGVGDLFLERLAENRRFLESGLLVPSDESNPTGQSSATADRLLGSIGPRIRNEPDEVPLEDLRLAGHVLGICHSILRGAHYACFSSRQLPGAPVSVVTVDYKLPRDLRVTDLLEIRSASEWRQLHEVFAALNRSPHDRRIHVNLDEALRLLERQMAAERRESLSGLALDLAEYVPVVGKLLSGTTLAAKVMNQLDRYRPMAVVRKLLQAE